MLSASIVVAEDFKTTNGKDYKNATVSRVEPDGIVLKSKSEITKLYFTELPKDVQERFHYDSAQAAQFNAAQQAIVVQQNTAKQQEQRQEQEQGQGQGQGLTSAAARGGADRRRDTVLGTHRRGGCADG